MNQSWWNLVKHELSDRKLWLTGPQRKLNKQKQFLSKEHKVIIHSVNHYWNITWKSFHFSFLCWGKNRLNNTTINFPIEGENKISNCFFRVICGINKINLLVFCYWIFSMSRIFDNFLEFSWCEIVEKKKLFGMVELFWSFLVEP
jgi:hypothetical protein